ncbi:MAG: binding 1 protein [Patescibacteria group bacterium]|nr:binding 1 protein [Patescibacteria group bacterium]
MKKIIALIFVFFFFMVSQSAYADTTMIHANLSYGKRNPEINLLQVYLVKKGLLETSITGFFGVKTLAAVKQLQQQNNISTTGFVGPLTRGLINSTWNDVMVKKEEIFGGVGSIAPDNSLVTTNNNFTTTTVIPNPLASQADMDRVRQIIESINSSASAGDTTGVLKHFSSRTAQSVSGTDNDLKSKYTIIRLAQYGVDIAVTTTKTTAVGSVVDADMVFVKEDGDWKYDAMMTEKYVWDKSDMNKGRGDPNGSPDLMIVGMTVLPTSEIFNDRDIEIAIVVRNIGLKSADGPWKLTVQMWTSTGEKVIAQVAVPTLISGQVRTVMLRPYDMGVRRFVDGDNTIIVSLNPEKTLIESDYSNNILNKIVKMRLMVD